MSEKPAPAAGRRRDDDVEQFTQQVAALCQGTLRIPALAHLERHEQIMQAEDDLEEWQAAEQFLTRWQAVATDLRYAATD